MPLREALIKAQLGALLNALQKNQHQIVIAILCLAALSWKYCLKFRPIFTSAALIGTAAALAVLTIFAYILTIVLYLLYPNYLDHFQPLVATYPGCGCPLSKQIFIPTLPIDLKAFARHS